MARIHLNTGGTIGEIHTACGLRVPSPADLETWSMLAIDPEGVTCAACRRSKEYAKAVPAYEAFRKKLGGGR